MTESPPPSIGLISLGCAKNLVDTQIMSGGMLASGLRLASDLLSADVLLVNTCAFIQDARDEAHEYIAAACEHKRADGCRAIIVTGCLPQRYRGALARQYPDVDAWIGVDQLEDIATIVRKVLKRPAGRRRPMVEVRDPPQRLFNPAYPSLVLTGGPFAYLKIAEGCDHACAFCAIPGIRGRFRSRRPGDILAEARALLGRGIRELNLIAQDVTFYGRDRRSGPRLPTLLRQLDALEGDFWIRLLYGYPTHVTDALLEVMAAARHILPYFDLPIQHSHPDILRAMRRADTIKVLPEMPDRLRRTLPGATLRTTCLVGFPGETEAHFQHLLDYVKRARFDHLGVFAFSPEEGTPAAKMPNPVAEEVAQERLMRLMRVQQAIVRQRNRERIGQSATVLLEHPPARRNGTWQARLPWQAPDVDGITRVAASGDQHPGAFRTVRITGARGYDLRAEIS